MVKGESHEKRKGSLWNTIRSFGRSRSRSRSKSECDPADDSSTTESTGQESAAESNGQEPERLAEQRRASEPLPHPAPKHIRSAFARAASEAWGDDKSKGAGGPQAESDARGDAGDNSGFGLLPPPPPLLRPTPTCGQIFCCYEQKQWKDSSDLDDQRKFLNLKRRFPTAPDAAIERCLNWASGHGGKAGTALEKEGCRVARWRSWDEGRD